MPKPLTIAIQRYQMQRLWPQFRSWDNRGNHVRWTGELQPTCSSQFYVVEVDYAAPLRPTIRVLSPKLKTHPDHSRLPHVFSDGSLCVHAAEDWRPDIAIATTILPWICLWLYFYEIWLLTGYWLGGGTHPDFPQHRSPDLGLAA